jgi:hypothetical protein
MAATAIDSLRGILNGFRDLNSKGIYTMNGTETDLLRQILLEVQALSLGGIPADNSVTTPKLADDSVTTAKILNANVTPAKLSQPYTQGSTVALSGVSVEFTGVPSWATLISIAVKGLTFTALDGLILQIGDGSINTSGYLGSCAVLSPTSSFTSRTDSLEISPSFTSAQLLDVDISLKKIGTSNSWVLSSLSAFSAASVLNYSVASKTLSGALDRFRLTSISGSPSFDGGTASISYQ